MEELKTPVLYVDSDLIFRRKPEEFMGLKNWTGDIWAHNHKPTGKDSESFPMRDFDVAMINWYHSSPSPSI
jgi:hypothetical protein